MSKVAIKIKSIIEIEAEYTNMILLQTIDEKIVFPIIVSDAEAEMLFNILKQESIKRSQTTYLLFDILERFEIEIQEIYIHKLKQGVFYTTIYCIKDEQIYEFEAIPSDALNLAIAKGKPIFIEKSILDIVGMPIEEMEKSFVETDVEEEYYNVDDFYDEENRKNHSKSSLYSTIDENTELITFPEKVLNDLLSTAVEEENFELASKIRDAIRAKQNSNIF
ncbi:MAG: bifunctional nuclease family protein [Bacteroidales bacterium]|nr:bifunctional nuclease family protein [Bacteroidales bacterium]